MAKDPEPNRGEEERKPPLTKRKRPEAEYNGAGILTGMKLRTKGIIRLLVTVVSTPAARAAVATNEPMMAPPAVVDGAGTFATRYGLFNGLDRRSWYSQGDFPEPFLVDDSGLEINEARLDWLHTRAGAQQSDIASVEVEKGFGLLTLEVRLPYERDAAPDETVQGVGNVELGARYPFYQFVSEKGFFDTTAGAAIEAGIPVNSPVSRHTESVPKVFNDLRIGENFTLQSLFGCSSLLGGGADGGLETFEYGFVFGYSIQRRWLPLPGIQQFIPMFELQGETQLNKDAPGRNSLLGNAAFRVNLNPIGRVQPRLGIGYVFPVNDAAREEAHWGLYTSLVFEY